MRAAIIVMDSLGVGELPDAAEYTAEKRSRTVILRDPEAGAAYQKKCTFL